jgi:DNA-binding SARP family transcriptional activator
MPSGGSGRDLKKGSEHRMLHVRTFGGLHISFDGKTETFLAGRGTKMWEILKYLLASCPKPVAIDKLIEAVCHDNDTNDPGKNVRDIVYRLRKTLMAHCADEDYILFTNGCYLWNPNVKCFIDFIEFSKYLRKARESDSNDEERMASFNAAIALYQGEFMGEKGESTERWASNFVSFYRRLFLQAVDSLSVLYERRLDYENVILLHNKALLIEPYEESLYERLIQILIKNGEYALAKRQYKQMEKLFAREFDAAPSQTLSDLYEEAVKASVRQPAALNKIKEQFDESAEHDGPIFCTPDTFTHIYKYGKRVDERIVFPVFLCKVTLYNNCESDLSKNKLDSAMKSLLRVILKNLRRGDIVCRYSPNQFLMMLTTMNSATLKQSIQRINSFYAHDELNCGFRLEIEIVPVKNNEKVA